MAARSEAWVCGRSLAGIAGSNPAGVMDVFFVSGVYIQVEVFASGWSLVQRRPPECDVSECDCEASKGEAMTRTRAEGLLGGGNPI